MRVDTCPYAHSVFSILRGVWILGYGRWDRDREMNEWLGLNEVLERMARIEYLLSLSSSPSPSKHHRLEVF
jgi:hypothetical protein